MKKILLSFVALAMSLTTFAETSELTLSFSRDEGKNIVVTVAGAPDVTATVQTTKAFRNSGLWAGDVETPSGHEQVLCPDVNFNTDPTIVVTFTLSGVPADFVFDAIDLDAYALNNGGGSQTNSRDADNNRRLVNMQYAVGDSNFVYVENEDLCLDATAEGGIVNGVIHKMHSAYSVYPATFKADESGNLTFTLTLTKGSYNPGSFIGMATFRLYTYDKRPIAEAALQTAIDEAEVTYNNCEAYELRVGTGLSQYVRHGDIQELSEAIDNAKNFQEFMDENTTAQEIYEQIDILKGVKVTYTLNLPQKGQYFRIFSAMAQKYAAFYSETGNIDLVDSPDDATILFYSPEGYLISWGTGFATTNTCQVASPDTIPETIKFHESARTVADGCAFIETSNSGNRFWQAASGDAVKITARDFSNYDQCDFSFEDVTVLPVEITNEYVTLYSPVNLNLPAGVEAYVASSVNHESKDVLITQVYEITANQGVLLKRTEDEMTNFEFEIATEPSEDPYTGQNLFRGNAIVVSFTPIAETAHPYILEGETFEPTNDGYLAAHAAYFSNPIASDETYGFREDDGSSIESVQTSIRQMSGIYNLAGMRLSKLQRGFNIVDGKKVIW